MTYREKLELYSQGKLDEQQKIEIERELEKQEALQDYLFEHQAPPGMDDFFDGTPAFGVSEEEEDMPKVKDDSEEIAKQINSSIRRAFVKTGVIATAIAVILTLFIVFALPHIVSAFYYNPSKSIGTDENGYEIEQMEQDMSVYAELTLPELGPCVTTGTDGYGYGNYSYYFDSSFNVGSNAEKTIDNVFNGNIKRGSFTCYNYRELQKLKEAEYFNKDYQEYDASFEEMTPSNLYYAYVTLDNTVPYEKFYADFVGYDEYGTDASWVWCGVQVDPDENESYHLKHGFFATPYLDTVNYEADENYPNVSWYDAKKELDTEEKAQNHFNDMLSYLIDHDKFNNLEGDLEPFITEEEKDFVSDNGLNVYGFIYVGDKDHIEKVAEVKNVKHISVQLAQ